AVPQVGAAVADPGQLEAAVLHPQRHHRGAHGQAFAALAAVPDDVLVGLADGVGQRAAGLYLAHDGVAGQGTGDLAELVAAHAIGHQPETQLGVAVVGVLVQLATQADMAEVAELDHVRSLAFWPLPGGKPVHILRACRTGPQAGAGPARSAGWRAARLRTPSGSRGRGCTGTCRPCPAAARSRRSRSGPWSAPWTCPGRGAGSRCPAGRRG